MHSCSEAGCPVGPHSHSEFARIVDANEKQACPRGRIASHFKAYLHHILGDVKKENGYVSIFEPNVQYV